MKCPHCQTNLLMSERQGVEIDYCPECRGVWLDRGELDKIMERSSAELVEESRAALASAPPPARPAGRDDRRYDDRGHDDRGGNRDDRRADTWSAPVRPPSPSGAESGYGYPKKKKKRSFVEDIFDF